MAMGRNILRPSRLEPRAQNLSVEFGISIPEAALDRDRVPPVGNNTRAAQRGKT